MFRDPMGSSIGYPTDAVRMRFLKWAPPKVPMLAPRRRFPNPVNASGPHTQFRQRSEWCSPHADPSP
eukprot:6540760-Pyramimonas_sp.AAC.1